MTKLLSSQISGQNGRVRFCMRCLNSFGSVEARSEHIEICQGHEPVTVLKPDDENLRLKNMNHKMPVLFVCYADFEFSTEGIETWEKKNRKEFYKWIWETRAFRTSPLLCKRESEKEVWYEANRETQKDWRLRSCKIICYSSWERCKKYLPYPSGLSRQVKIPRVSRTPKHVTCEKEFFDEDDENPIIRDHCHFSGRFRGAAIWNSRSQRRFLLSFTTSPKNQIERES